MSEYLSVKPGDFMQWSWEQIEPYYQELEKRPLEAGNLTEWLAHWSRLSEMVYETFQRLYVGTTVDTTDEDTKKRFNTFLDTIFTRSEAAEQRLKEKLLQSGLELRGFEIPLRNLRAEAEIFRAENLPFLAEELKLSTRYDEIIGAQTALWEARRSR